MTPNECTWKTDNTNSGLWATSCHPGRRFKMYVGTPRSRGFEFCPYCGRMVVEALYEAPDWINNYNYDDEVEGP